MQDPFSPVAVAAEAAKRLDERIAKLQQLRDLLQDEALVADLPLLGPCYAGRAVWRRPEAPTIMVTGIHGNSQLNGAYAVRVSDDTAAACADSLQDAAQSIPSDIPSQSGEIPHPVTRKARGPRVSRGGVGVTDLCAAIAEHGPQESRDMAQLVGMKWGEPWWDKVSYAISHGYLARIANGHLDLTEKGWDRLKLKPPANVQPPAPYASAPVEKQEVLATPVSAAPAPATKVRTDPGPTGQMILRAVRTGRNQRERLWTYRELIDYPASEVDTHVERLLKAGWLREAPGGALEVIE